MVKACQKPEYHFFTITRADGVGGGGGGEVQREEEIET
jgi:hypothetical protein